METENILNWVKIYLNQSLIWKSYMIYIQTQVALINAYGPTEGTCICSTYNIIEEEFNELKNW